MDPYYRTLRGFIVLVEKEWLSFGHPFQERGGVCSLEDGPEAIPVFLQWLDCVWQTLFQFPNQFEFNNAFLVELAESIFSGRYGTFLFSNQKERRKYLAGVNTESFWTHIEYNHAYKNPFFLGKLDSVLVPTFDPRSLTLWGGFYLRWYDPSLSVKLPRAGLGPCGQDVLAFTNARELSEKQQLERHLLALETVLQNVQQEIQSKQEILKEVSAGQSVMEARHHVLYRSRSNIVSGIVSKKSPALPRSNTGISSLRERKAQDSSLNLDFFCADPGSET